MLKNSTIDKSNSKQVHTLNDAFFSKQADWNFSPLPNNFNWNVKKTGFGEKVETIFCDIFFTFRPDFDTKTTRE
ncbi:hypothetical protein T02_12469 [Trichinella nativa]|uniref:Uncharacterized protein n=1 Tax=Trichinella nativa TaxID=6335 RepID=A0A0V1LA91_9BILA|nr:hypothetical protein T02_12469 [Trichinella nativa]